MNRRAPRDRATGEAGLMWGVAIATVGVALAMDPGSYAVFGPVKGFVLAAGALVCMVSAAREGAPQLWPHGSQASRDRMVSVAGYLAGAIVVLVVLSLVMSVDRRVSLLGPYPEYLGAVPLLCTIVIGVAGCVLAASGADLKRLAQVFACALGVVAVYAIAQRAGSDIVEWRSTLAFERVRSTLGNPSNLGVFLVGSVPYAVWALRCARGRLARGVLAAVIGLGVITLALTLSRGAWLGAMAGIATWLVLSWRAGRLAAAPRLGSVARASVAVVVAVGALLLVPGVAARVFGSWSAAGGTGAWRLGVWREWLVLIGESPLLGFGPGTTGLVALGALSAESVAGGGVDHVVGSAHNVALDLAAMAGVPTALAVIALAVVALTGAWRAVVVGRTREGLPFPELGASVAGMLVALQFHFLTLDSAPLFALSVGLLVGLAATESARTRSTRTQDRTPIQVIPLWLAGGLLGIVVVAFGLLVAADRAASRAWDMAERGDPWISVAAEFRRAQDRAPWEHAFTAAHAAAAARASLAAGDAWIAQDALGRIDAAIAAHPRDPAYVRLRGDLLSARGKLERKPDDFAEALASYEAALALSPHDVRALVGVGTCFVVLGRPDDAISVLERALSVAPDFEPARRALEDARAVGSGR